MSSRKKEQFMKVMRSIIFFLFVTLAFSAIAMAQTGQTERTPISTFKNGIPLELFRDVHKKWNIPYLLKVGDASAYVNLRASEIFRTAMLPAGQPTKVLSINCNSDIGKIKAQINNFGKLTLDEFWNHPKSYAQDFIVAHKERWCRRIKEFLPERLYCAGLL